MKKQLLFVLAISVITAGVLSGTVLAQGTDTTNRQAPTREELEVRTQQVEERQAQRILERCEAIKQRLTAHIGRVNQATEQQVGVYERLNGRLDAVITRANEAGYDSFVLVEARDSIGAKIIAFSDASTEATAGMSAAADAACETDAAPYGTALSDARLSLQAVREASAEVRTTFRNTAIPALQDFVAWLEVNQTVEQE